MLAGNMSLFVQTDGKAPERGVSQKTCQWIIDFAACGEQEADHTIPKRPSLGVVCCKILILY
jgi:hypothetical protein